MHTTRIRYAFGREILLQILDTLSDAVILNAETSEPGSSPRFHNTITDETPETMK